MVTHSGPNFKHFVIHKNQPGKLPFFHFCFAHNIDAILTKPARIESPEREHSIGADFVKIGSMLRKLWAKHYHDKNCVIFLEHSGNFMVQFTTSDFCIKKIYRDWSPFQKIEKKTIFFLNTRVPIETSHPGLSNGTGLSNWINIKRAVGIICEEKYF